MTKKLQQAVEMWDNQLAVHGIRMSKKKTEVLEVSRGQPVPRLEIIVDGQQLKQTTAFRYLGSWQLESGDLDREIQARLQGTGIEVLFATSKLLSIWENLFLGNVEESIQQGHGQLSNILSAKDDTS
ncbi:Hypothetical predicted protein [Paramuricea clavata]|uniref:Uncharacterized protein n=1 Tax=Paramuricea clavata TaxID=317549 RepID=A0A7D9L2Q7_PARCT|nr:Hypothetical predicted protein [Paramuricea clavata]